MGKKYTLVIYINFKKKKKMLNTLWLWLNDIRVIKAKGKKKKILMYQYNLHKSSAIFKITKIKGALVKISTKKLLYIYIYIQVSSKEF